MDRFIIVSDLDRTLLNKKSKISFKSKLYIRKLIKKGYLFVIATGRPYQGAIQYYNQLKLSTPLICDNGSAIYFPCDHSKDIFFDIPLNIFIRFLKEIKAYIHAAIVSNYQYIFYQNRKDVPFFIQHLSPSRIIIEGEIEKIIKGPILNPSIFVNQDGVEFVENILKKEEYSKVFSYRLWNEKKELASFELFHKKANKGEALKKVKFLLNIKEENDLVFGDGLNDYEMLNVAYNSVMMINGKEKLKDVAKYTTKFPNYKNGEIKFIKKFIKNKKHQ